MTSRSLRVALAIGWLAGCGVVHTPELDGSSAPSDGPGGDNDSAVADIDAVTSDAAVDAAVDARVDAAVGLRVFVTHIGYQGSALGGLAGADSRCTSLAAANGLGGTWMAWLSSSTQGPATRFTTRSNGPYIKARSGVVVAASWADLTDGLLASPIDEPLAGAVPTVVAWTNTNVDGSPASANDCGGWAVGSAAGGVGRNDATGATWTLNTTVNCNNYNNTLLCFEQ